LQCRTLPLDRLTILAARIAARVVARSRLQLECPAAEGTEVVQTEGRTAVVQAEGRTAVVVLGTAVGQVAGRTAVGQVAGRTAVAVLPVGRTAVAVVGGTVRAVELACTVRVPARFAGRSGRLIVGGNLDPSCYYSFSSLLPLVFSNAGPLPI